MRRQIMSSVLITLALASSASAQVYRNGFAGGTGGLGNAGGFATGGGMANGTTTSNNFGPMAGQLNAAAVAPGAMQSIPGVNSYSMGVGVGSGMPAVGNGANMSMGMTPFVPGIAPPGFARDMFGYEMGSADGAGYTDFGTALTYSALGFGYGGMGYGPMAYGPMGFGPMGYSGFAPGMVPGTYLPPVGAITPADMALMATMNGAVNANVMNGNVMNGVANDNGIANQGPLPARITPNVKPGANLVDDDANGNGNASRRGPVRRSFLNDNVPMATSNAIRIQNRLQNVKSPNFKNIKVLIANRTAILSGAVDSSEDEQFAIRMVGLEPGVLEVKSELTVNGTAK